MGERRGVVVLGATGSVGRSTCNVLRRHADRFRVVGLSAGRQSDALDLLATEFEPEFVVLADSGQRREASWTGEWRYGAAALIEAAADERADIVVNALVGSAGLEATLSALEAGKRLALANKESLVAGGSLVVRAWRDGTGDILPVDSEHSAIHQCLAGRPSGEVRRLILTASGGPFRQMPVGEFADIRCADALVHPTWNMGSKITVDSATLANKALEVIEAHLLFDIALGNIDVVVHPSSIVHSMVEFQDGSTMAQMGFPTMEIPILYALSAPERLRNEFEPFDPVAAGPLEFETMRRAAFPMFDLGLTAARIGGTAPAAYSAANEVAVQAFLAGSLSFTGIPAVVESVLHSWDGGPADSVRTVVEADAEARRRATEAAGNCPDRPGC
ncbi:MAG: 1-deoxy-D-xylulose-5-phosphate reductoisomerase [Gemmatimonadota bacterium]|nr:1-deoxy-D-xylulose-5-phosphate reductoisomerase [Gemmatimonadota bacterium]